MADRALCEGESITVPDHTTELDLEFGGGGSEASRLHEAEGGCREDGNFAAFPGF
jgi:hypothetical protein